MIIKKDINAKGLFAIFYLLTIFFFIQCENEPNPLGLNILPPGDALQLYSDTITLKAENSDRVFNAAVNSPFAMLGSYEDNRFGFAKASFFMQVVPKDIEDNRLYKDIEITSAKLYIVKEDFYGSKNASFDLDIYPADSIPYDTGYYSDFEPELYYDKNTQVTDGPFSFSPDEAIISIPLSLDFVKQHILTATTSDSVFSSNTAFLNHFKGFYFVSKDIHSVDGAIESLNFSNDASGLSLFTNDNDTIDFVFNSDYCTNVNVFETNELVSIQQMNENRTNSDNWVYIQSMGGVSAKVDMGALSDWMASKPSDSTIINKAEIFIDVINEDVNIAHFPPPDKLTFTYTSEYRVFDNLPDSPCYLSINNNDEITTQSYNYYGGYYNDSLYNYTFRISRYIQVLMNKQIDEHEWFYLTPGLYDKKYFELVYNSSIANRVVIDKDIKLIITYSEINN